RRDGDRDGQVVLIGRRLAAFDVSGEEEQDLLDRPAAPDHRRRLAERRDHPVGPPQREHAPQLGGLLALDRREGPDAALALQADHALVEATPEHHRAVEGLQVAGGELRVERGIQVALAVENRQVFDLEPRLEDGFGHDRSSTLILPLADNRRIINGGPKIPPHGRTAMANVTRRWFVTCGALLVTAAAADLESPRAQPAPASAGRPDPKLREDLLAHNHAPSVIPFGVTGVPLRPLYHMSAFLWEGVPVFDIRRAAGGASDMLVRDPALGRALAQTLGSHTAALMRGHGAVVVGPSL